MKIECPHCMEEFELESPTVEQARAQAFEEAAEACDARVETAYRYGNRESEQCAIAIRALAKAKESK